MLNNIFVYDVFDKETNNRNCYTNDASISKRYNNYFKIIKYCFHTVGFKSGTSQNDL